MTIDIINTCAAFAVGFILGVALGFRWYFNLFGTSTGGIVTPPAAPKHEPELVTFQCPYGGITAHWREDKTCSGCGSLKPDYFLELLEGGEILGVTTKDYKVYIKNPLRDNGFGKFYFQHMDSVQQQEFAMLYTKGKIKTDAPFARLPFFMGRRK